MGRGALDNQPSAKKLLYGRRRQGPGPQPIAIQPLSYQEMVERFFDQRLPASLISELPDFAFTGDPYRFQSERLDNDLVTVCYLGGISGASMTIAFARDCGGKTISFDYDEHSDGRATPGLDSERLFLSRLNQHISDPEVIIEMATNQRDQLEAIVAAYGAEGFAIGPQRYGTDISQAEALKQLVEAPPLDPAIGERLVRFASFPQIWADDQGRADLFEAMRFTPIYLQRPLADFGENS